MSKKCSKWERKVEVWMKDEWNIPLKAIKVQKSKIKRKKNEKWYNLIKNKEKEKGNECRRGQRNKRIVR